MEINTTRLSHFRLQYMNKSIFWALLIFDITNGLNVFVYFTVLKGENKIDRKMFSFFFHGKLLYLQNVHVIYTSDVILRMYWIFGVLSQCHLLFILHIIHTCFYFASFWYCNVCMPVCGSYHIFFFVVSQTLYKYTHSHWHTHTFSLSSVCRTQF